MKVSDRSLPPLRRALRSLLKTARRAFLAAADVIIETYIQRTPSRPRVLLAREATFSGDGFITQHVTDFLRTSQLTAAYDWTFEGLPPSWQDNFGRDRTLLWRTHIAIWAADRALNLRGDFVECGVHWGVLSGAICRYFNFADRVDRRFLLFDTWGLDSEHPTYQENIYSAVERKFKPFPNVHLIRGSVPASLRQVDITEIAYLSIDMNGATAERAALEELFDRVVPGGVIYFDDYNWKNFRALRQTVDDFLIGRTETLLHFPSGNSIIVKM